MTIYSLNFVIWNIYRYGDIVRMYNAVVTFCLQPILQMLIFFDVDLDMYIWGPRWLLHLINPINGSLLSEILPDRSTNGLYIMVLGLTKDTYVSCKPVVSTCILHIVRGLVFFMVWYWSIYPHPSMYFTGTEQNIWLLQWKQTSLTD